MIMAVPGEILLATHVDWHKDSKPLPRMRDRVKALNGEIGEITEIEGAEDDGIGVRVDWLTTSGWKWAYWHNLELDTPSESPTEAI